VRAPQQAADARQHASLAPNRRRGRRIRNGRLHTHYRVIGRGSSMRAQAANERLSVGGRPNQGKTRQKMMEVGDSPGSKCIYRVRQPPPPGACAQRSGTATCVESNRPRRRYRINFTRFRLGARQTHGELPQKPDPASRTSCRLLSRLRVLKTAEPGKMRLNARYGGSAVREECARSAGVSI
jgi:hypothetical protein